MGKRIELIERIEPQIDPRYFNKINVVLNTLLEPHLEFIIEILDRDCTGVPGLINITAMADPKGTGSQVILHYIDKNGNQRKDSKLFFDKL